MQKSSNATFIARAHIDQDLSKAKQEKKVKNSHETIVINV